MKTVLFIDLCAILLSLLSLWIAIRTRRRKGFYDRLLDTYRIAHRRRDRTSDHD